MVVPASHAFFYGVPKDRSIFSVSQKEASVWKPPYGDLNMGIHRGHTSSESPRPK